MTDSTLNTIGLAFRGRNLAAGEEPVAEACKGRRAKLVLLAEDAAENTVRRAQRLAELGGAQTLTLPYGKSQLGFCLGRSVCAVAAVTDKGLAALLLKKLGADRPECRTPQTADREKADDGICSKGTAEKPRPGTGN